MRAFLKLNIQEGHSIITLEHGEHSDQGNIFFTAFKP